MQACHVAWSSVRTLRPAVRLEGLGGLVDMARTSYIRFGDDESNAKDISDTLSVAALETLAM